MPFQKGQSGNPAGRPRNEQTITTVLRRLLAEKQDGTTGAEHVAATLLKMATDGDVKAIAIVLERIDGKVTEPIDVTSKGKRLVTFNIQRAATPSDDSDD